MHQFEGDNDQCIGLPRDAEPGDPLVLKDCSGGDREGQHFSFWNRPAADAALVSTVDETGSSDVFSATELCWDARGGRLVAGTRLQLWDCFFGKANADNQAQLFHYDEDTEAIRTETTCASASWAPSPWRPRS